MGFPLCQIFVSPTSVTQGLRLNGFVKFEKFLDDEQKKMHPIAKPDFACQIWCLMEDLPRRRRVCFKAITDGDKSQFGTVCFVRFWEVDSNGQKSYPMLAYFKEWLLSIAKSFLGWISLR